MNISPSMAFVAAFAASLSGCELISGPRASDPAWSKVILDSRVTDAYTRFGFELFRQLQEETPDENVFVSPTSAAFALAMAHAGARGETAAEIARALGVGELDLATVTETNRKWLAALRTTGDPAAELAIANGVWYRERRPLLPSYEELVRSAYGAAVQPITTGRAINDWVGSATRGAIRQIAPEPVPADVVAYLINAVYFRADWTDPFDPRETRAAPFRLSDGSTATVQMMGRTGSVRMRADANAEMVRLPYGSDRFSMVLLLPRGDSDLSRLASTLTPEGWSRWMSELTPVSPFRIELPRIEIEWESSLEPSLTRLGMVVPFLAGRADFSGMFDGGGPWIDDVLQKTYLKVDEKGTTAAAVTKVAMVDSMPAGITFDRPFLLVIHDHATETILFLGQVADPRG